MEIEVKDNIGIKIRDRFCWMCGTELNITVHHAIPRCLNPNINVEIPVCSVCHDKINEVDLQGITRFLYKVVKQIDDLTYYLRFDKWKKGTGKRKFKNQN